MRSSSVCLCTLLSLALLPSSAFPETWHVFPDGTGDAPTIQAAIDSATAGDAVLLAPGEYTWTNQASSGENMISLKSDLELTSENGPMETIVDAEGQGRLLLAEDLTNTIVRGVRFRNSGASYAVYVDETSATGESPGLTLADCHVVDNDQAGIGVGGPSLTVTGCRIENNAGGGVNASVFLQRSVGSRSFGSEGIVRIEKTLFYGNGAYGLAVGEAPTLEVARCTFVENAGTAQIALYAFGSDVTLSELIVAYSPSGAGIVHFECVIPPFLTCSNIYGNPGGDVIGGNLVLELDDHGNFSALPRFCDRDAGDFRLAANSPCVPGLNPTGAVCDTVGAFGVGCPDGQPLNATYGVEVDGSGDFATIPEAMAFAATGDTIRLGAGTFTWTNQSGSGDALVTLEPGVSLVGAGRTTTILDAEGQGRVLDLQNTSTMTTVRSLTARGGVAGEGGGVRSLGAPLLLEDVTLEDNEADDGGGMYLAEVFVCGLEPPAPDYYRPGMVTLRNCTVKGNTAESGAGAATHHGALAIQQTTFANNQADIDGGGLNVVDAAQVSIVASEFIGNFAGNRGGAVFAELSEIMLADTDFHGNQAAEGGGLNGRYADVSFSGSVFTSQVATSRGGALFISKNPDTWAGTYTIETSTFVGNESPTGSHVFSSGPMATFTANIFARGIGGAPVDHDQVLYQRPEIACSAYFANPADSLGGTDLGGNFFADPLFCGDASSDSLTLRSNSPCAPGNHPTGEACGLIGARPVDCEGVVGVPPVAGAVSVTQPALGPVHPNPLRGSTQFRIALPEEGWARVAIFDAMGRRVRTVVDGTLSAGPHAYMWDGRDDAASRVSSGAYFLRFETSARAITRKVILVR